MFGSCGKVEVRVRLVVLNPKHLLYPKPKICVPAQDVEREVRVRLALLNPSAKP